MYIKVSNVKKKMKALGKRVSPGFISALDLYIDQKLEMFAKNAGSFKTLKREDILVK